MRTLVFLLVVALIGTVVYFYVLGGPAQPVVATTTTPAPIQPGAASSSPATFVDYNDYSGAISQARSENKLLLLHFTGSDWCPYCQMEDAEVLSKPEFQNFSAAHFIFVTLDFRHNPPPDGPAQQALDALSSKYGVTGFPTLLVVDASENVRGRIEGYNPGSGPDGIISQLTSYASP